MDVAIGGRGNRAIAAPVAAQRFEPDHRRRIVEAAAQNGAVGGSLRVIRCGSGAHGDAPCLRVGIMCGRRERGAVDAVRRDERLERKAPHARPARRLAARRRHQTTKQRRGIVGQRPDFLGRSRERLERFGDAESIGHRAGASRHVDERALRILDLLGGRVRQTSDCLAQRGAHVAVRLRLEPGGERGLRRVYRAAIGVSRRLSDGVRRLGTDFRQLVPEPGDDVGDDRRALEAAERPDGEAPRLRIRAVRAGSKRADVVRRGRAAIFGLKDGEAGLRGCGGRTQRNGE